MSSVKAGRESWTDILTPASIGRPAKRIAATRTDATTGKVTERLIRRFIAVAFPDIEAIFTPQVFGFKEDSLAGESISKAWSNHFALAQCRDLCRAEPQFFGIKPLIVGTQWRAWRVWHGRLAA